MATPVTNLKDAVDMIVECLEESAEVVLGYIGKNDELRLPRYPAVVVTAAGRDKEVGGTHKFDITLRLNLWVYHAKMTEGHATRSQADLELVDVIESALEKDMTFNDRIIFGFIENEQPGLMQARKNVGDVVVGTKMSWIGVTRKMFT